LSKNTKDYIDPKLKDPNASLNKFDSTDLKNSHFNLGCSHSSPINQYETIYDTNMFYKVNPKPLGESKFKYIKPNIRVIGEAPGSFISENQTKYEY